MKFLLLPLFVFVAAPVAVSACQGECIVGITNAFLGNYSSPIQTVLDNLVSYTIIPLYIWSLSIIDRLPKYPLN